MRARDGKRGRSCERTRDGRGGTLPHAAGREAISGGGERFTCGHGGDSGELRADRRALPPRGGRPASVVALVNASTIWRARSMDGRSFAN